MEGFIITPEIRRRINNINYETIIEKIKRRKLKMDLDDEELKYTKAYGYDIPEPNVRRLG